MEVGRCRNERILLFGHCNLFQLKFLCDSNHLQEQELLFDFAHCCGARSVCFDTSVHTYDNRENFCSCIELECALLLASIDIEIIQVRRSVLPYERSLDCDARTHFDRRYAPLGWSDHHRQTCRRGGSDDGRCAHASHAWRWSPSITTLIVATATCTPRPPPRGDNPSLAPSMLQSDPCGALATGLDTEKTSRGIGSGIQPGANVPYGATGGTDGFVRIASGTNIGLERACC